MSGHLHNFLLSLLETSYFDLLFRMLNILLPAYSRSYAALDRAGLITAADETENQELKNLVFRERAVVWADQGGSGNPLNTEKKGEERHETGCTGLELAPALSFSQLLYHTNSPCSKLSYHHPVFCINMFRCSQMVSYPDTQKVTKSGIAIE